MTSEYLLPCNCGRTHRVTQRRAGETLVCECGASVDVPTLRELRQLPVAAETAAPAAVWGRRQGVMFLGLLIAATSLAAWGYFYFYRMPKPPEFMVPQSEIDRLDPLEAWAFWTRVRDGISYITSMDVAVVLEQTRRAQLGARVSLGICLFGLALAAGGWLTRPRQAVRR